MTKRRLLSVGREWSIKKYPGILKSRLLPAGVVSRRHRSVENSDPSEDSEALSKIARRNAIQAENLPGGVLPNEQSAPTWFAVYATSRHEKRVALHLSMREIEHYLPLYRTQRKWSDGSRVTLNLPLFPGYIFVRIERTQRVRVLEVPGVLAVVGGTGGETASLLEADIDALRSGLRLCHVEPHPSLDVGQRARIRYGAFAGKEGVVVRKKNNIRVVLNMNTITQSFAVEVDLEELEELGTMSPPSISTPNK